MSVLSTVTGRGQVTIPAHIRKLLGLSAGKKIVISYTDEILEIRPLPETVDIMSLYASVKSRDKATSVEKAIAVAKKTRAKKIARQTYE